MASINLVAIVILPGLVLPLVMDCVDQRQRDAAPAFPASSMPDVPANIDAGIWQPRRAPAE